MDDRVGAAGDRGRGGLGRHVGIGVVVVVAAALMVIGFDRFRGDGGDADDPDAETAASAGASPAGDGRIDTGSGDGRAGADASTTTTASVAPASAADPDAPADGTEGWIRAEAMTSGTIELSWSRVAGADRYQVYRFIPDADFEPATTSVADGILIHDGPDRAVVDTAPVAETLVTYLLVTNLADGGTGPRLWTQALAIDDAVPPAPLTGLVAEVTAAGVELRWNPSPDDVEFASYSVSVVDDAGQPRPGDVGEDPERLRYLGGGGDLEQTSFIDGDPPVGTVDYVVWATDFHGNRSQEGRVTVEVPAG